MSLALCLSHERDTNLEITICVDEKVTRLQIAVQDIGRVNGFEAPESLPSSDDARCC
jgi:hypothetical protein